MSPSLILDTLILKEHNKTNDWNKQKDYKSTKANRLINLFPSLKRSKGILMPRAETQWRPFLWISLNIALSFVVLHTGENKVYDYVYLRTQRYSRPVSFANIPQNSGRTLNVWLSDFGRLRGRYYFCIICVVLFYVPLYKATSRIIRAMLCVFRNYEKNMSETQTCT